MLCDAQLNNRIRNPIYRLKILLSSYCAADLSDFELSAIPDSLGTLVSSNCIAREPPFLPYRAGPE
jgi:hypothetical protein